MFYTFEVMDVDVLKKVKDKLFEKDISMSQAEKMANMKDGSLRQFMSGRSKNPTLDTLNCIAQIFGISVSNLLDESIIPNYAERKNLPWDDKIFQQIVISLSSFLKKSETTISSEEAESIIKNFYYSYRGNNESDMNKAFNEWLLKKLTGKN